MRNHQTPLQKKEKVSGSTPCVFLFFFFQEKKRRKERSHVDHIQLNSNVDPCVSSLSLFSSARAQGKEKEGMIGGGGSRVLIFLYLFFHKESERPREPSTSDPFFNQRKVVPEVISLSRRKEKLRSNILPLIRSETWRVGQVVETFLSDSPTHFL